MLMSQPYFEGEISGQSNMLNSLSLTSAGQLYLKDESQILAYQPNCKKQILEPYYKDKILEFYKDEISELQNPASNSSYLQIFTDQHYSENEVLESQNLLVNVVNSVNRSLDAQIDTNDVYVQENKLKNEHSLKLIQGLSFSNWQLFKIWLKQFAKQEG
ncbi:37902_t:CDS:1, partial [Gigaspora margarita]